MGLVDSVRRLFQSHELDVKQRFDILREAVSGTMSKFYMVKDRKTDEVFGLKVLDVKKTHAFESRFLGLEKPSEGEIAIQFQHERIVKTFEYGKTTKGETYVLMEYLDGPGLNALIRAKAAKLKGRRLELMRQMGQALQVVHEAGYIHRDVCPRNFICTPNLASLKLIDFGLTVPATHQYMQPGNRTGTPNYMAPEILRRRPTDQRLDIFALGVTCFQLCTFELPWPGQDVSGKAAVLHDTREPTNLLTLRPDLNPALADLIHACMSTDPSDRPSSVDQFLRQLGRIAREAA
jgi:serine/threonine-protein kinase